MIRPGLSFYLPASRVNRSRWSVYTYYWMNFTKCGRLASNGTRRPLEDAERTLLQDS